MSICDLLERNETNLRTEYQDPIKRKFSRFVASLCLKSQRGPECEGSDGLIVCQ